MFFSMWLLTCLADARCTNYVFFWFSLLADTSMYLKWNGAFFFSFNQCERQGRAMLRPKIWLQSKHSDTWRLPKMSWRTSTMLSWKTEECQPGPSLADERKWSKHGEKSNKLKEVARSYGNYVNSVCVFTCRIQDSFSGPHSKLQHLGWHTCCGYWS